MFRGIKLRQREVINISTAERIGIVSDIEIDENTGNIKSIIVPGRFHIFSKIFGQGEIVIPWQNIEVVGKDVILVRILELPDNGNS